MTLSLALDILHYGVPLSLVCAGAGLVFALVLIAIVIRSSPGNERMRQISGAIQEGAKAYLNRQIITISMIATIIFLLLFFFKDHPTAIGFVIGAFCSLAAGYIGMRIAVLANTHGFPIPVSATVQSLSDGRASDGIQRWRGYGSSGGRARLVGRGRFLQFGRQDGRARHRGPQFGRPGSRRQFDQCFRATRWRNLYESSRCRSRSCRQDRERSGGG